MGVILQIAFFVLTASALWGGLHLYLWRRLVRDPLLPRPWRGAATAAIAALAVAIPALGVFQRLAPSGFARLLAWPAYVWMGWAMYAVLFVAALGAARFLVDRQKAAEERTDPARRVFLARLSAGAALAAAGSVTGFGIRKALSAIRAGEVVVALPRLPPALNGFRIVQLSDIHAGLTVSQAFINDLVAKAMSLGPDLIAVTGDIADGDARALEDVVAPLAELSAPAGVYYCTGNHDYYSGVEPWVEALRRLGFTVLRNQRLSIGAGQDSFDLAGVDDYSAGDFHGDHGADFEKALRGRDPARELVLLAHQPRHIHEAAARGVGLQLSGHTHGGQMWPFHYAVKAQQGGYLGGTYRLGKTQLYVSRGSGYWGPPLRVAAPAEVSAIVLTAG